MCNKIIAIILCAVMLCGVLPFAVFAEGEEINLALGIEYIIETGEPISKSYSNINLGNTLLESNEGQFTDGNLAPLTTDTNAWYRSYSGKSRIVTFDLGAICAVSRVNASFLQLKSSNIYAPRYINISLSENGDDYQTVGEYSDKKTLHGSVITRHNAEISLESTYSARFVRVEYCNDYYTYCDEIEIFGSKDISGNEKKIKPENHENSGGYVGAVGGRRDIVKLYNGYYPDDSSVGVLTEAEVLPYIAYINSNGEISGRMFDSIALLPCDVQYPSGGYFDKKIGSNGAVMSDYELYLENTFAPGQNLDAINKVVGKVNLKLGTEEKVGIFLTIPYPDVLNKPFGDINGDGVTDYCRTLEDRIAIIEWLIDKYISTFESNNYKNLVLEGFYWYRETVDYADSDHEAELLQITNSYIHDQKLESFISFGYLSPGFDHWEDLGFDSAVMKSDIDEKLFPPEMVAEYAQSVYNNRLGTEISTAKTEDYALDDENYHSLGYNYENHMYFGSKTGYGNALNIYEQGIGPGTLYEFCYSDISTPKGIYLRRLYDLTYRYINGNYNNLPPSLSLETEIELIYGDTQVTLDLGISDVDSYWENVVVEFPRLPEHGKVTVSADKQMLIYNVDSDYIGTDSFALTVTDGFNKSEEVVVNISVVEPIVSEPEDEVSHAVLPPPIIQQTQIPIWLIVLLSILASAMIIVAVVTIVRPNKEN